MQITKLRTFVRPFQLTGGLLLAIGCGGSDHHAESQSSSEPSSYGQEPAVGDVRHEESHDDPSGSSNSIGVESQEAWEQTGEAAEEVGDEVEDAVEATGQGLEAGAEAAEREFEQNP